MRVYQATVIGAGLVIALGHETGYGQPAKQASSPQQIERGRYVVEIAVATTATLPGTPRPAERHRRARG